MPAREGQNPLVLLYKLFLWQSISIWVFKCNEQAVSPCPFIINHINISLRGNIKNGITSKHDFQSEKMIVLYSPLQIVSYAFN